MLYIVLAFLWLSLLLYILMGGADFGAGIIELFTRKINRPKTHNTMYRAIGPIWEANHMWLIIAIVILFVAFPFLYSSMSVYLHIPLTAMLLGIIARGTAFSFRHYDAVTDSMQIIYRRVFMYASCITPLFLGIVAGAAVSGNIDTHASDFLHGYVLGWLHFFPVAVGVFTVAICGFLASAYLIGETNNPIERNRFIAKARTTNIIAGVAGAMVYGASVIDNVPLISWSFGNVVGLTAMLLATISLFFFWYFITRGRKTILRPLAAFQVTMIFVMVSYNNFPDIVRFKDGATLSLLTHAAPYATISILGWSLLIGSLFILPALFYLLYSFQRKKISGSLEKSA